MSPNEDISNINLNTNENTNEIAADIHTTITSTDQKSRRTITPVIPETQQLNNKKLPKYFCL